MHNPAYTFRLPVLVESDRYTFRHDSVVKVMVDAIINVISKKKSSPPAPSKVIKFVKAGAKAVSQKKRPPTGILDEAKDWVLHCDLGGNNPTVPSFIAILSFALARLDMPSL